MRSIHYIYIASALLLVALFTACTNESDTHGQGMLQLRIGVNQTDVTVDTRAGNELSLDSCKVLIKNGNGDIIRKYDDATKLPAEEWLVTGTYTVEAFLGVPKKAEFDHPCYAGKDEITIVANKSIQKEIVCKLVQSKVTVIYEKGITANFSNYVTEVKMGTAKLEFKKDSTKIGYFHNSTTDKQKLTCTITATPKSGSNVEKSFEIADIQPRTHYIVRADYNTQVNEGGLKFKIEVSKEPDPENDDINIPLSKYPVIESPDRVLFALNASATQPEHFVVTAKGYPKLDTLVLIGDFLSKALALPKSIDVLNLEPSALFELQAKGFVLSLNEKDPNDNLPHQQVKLTIPVPVTDKDKSGTLNLIATDTKKQRRVGNPITISVTDMNVSTEDIPVGDIWATHTTLRGSLNKRNTALDVVKFQYRKEGEPTWTSVPASKEGDNYTAAISSLSPSKKYEYAITEGKGADVKVGVVKTFTTEEASQVPNSNFNDWNGNNPWPNGGSSFWDTGNEAAKAAKLELTTPSAELPANITSGKAANLTSKKGFAIIMDVFAAGNLFVGDFIGISGIGADMTFGRPYSSRPSKLKGYYRYNSKVIDWDKKGGLEGKNDRFHIYIMLRTNTHYLNTTKKETLFDFENIKQGKDGNVIAFAELTNEQIEGGTDTTPAVVMSEYASFELPLKYFRTDVKPEYIIIAASSSKYGDYLSGGIGSELLVDEFELVFE